MWELFSGDKYKNLNSVEFLKSGDRLDKPKDCSDALWEILYSCWSINPKERPDWENLFKKIHHLQIVYP
jgi:hypothetical protein